MANRRVVVTGLGAVTPLGNDVASYWDGLKNGRNGIDFITRFDTSDLKAKLAGELKDFQVKDHLDAKIIRNQKIHDFFTSSTLKTVLIALVVLFVLLVALRIFSRFYRRAQVERIENALHRLGAELLSVSL
jgi:3-oxoacyl-(acyl-carrier-protein) synthase